MDPFVYINTRALDIASGVVNAFIAICRPVAISVFIKTRTESRRSLLSESERSLSEPNAYIFYGAEIIEKSDDFDDWDIRDDGFEVIYAGFTDDDTADEALAVKDSIVHYGWERIEDFKSMNFENINAWRVRIKKFAKQMGLKLGEIGWKVAVNYN